MAFLRDGISSCFEPTLMYSLLGLDAKTLSLFRNAVVYSELSV